MKMRLMLVFIGALLLAGCMVGPKYVKPDTPTPPAFKEAPPDSFKETRDWKFAQPGAPSLPPKWWEAFGDPQLTNLEEQVVSGNQNLKIAEARFRQARALIRVNRSAQFPTISTNPSIASLRDSANRPYFPVQPTSTGDFVLPFDLSYEVDLWGRVRRTVNAARDEAQATAADRARRRSAFRPNSRSIISSFAPPTPRSDFLTILSRRTGTRFSSPGIASKAARRPNRTWRKRRRSWIPRWRRKPTSTSRGRNMNTPSRRCWVKHPRNSASKPRRFRRSRR